MLQESLEKIGCTTPFGNDLENICWNSTKGEQALKLFVDMNMNPRDCLYPCKYLSDFGLTYSPFDMIQDRGRNVFYLRTTVPTYESEYTYTVLDLFAALGGYIGFFLGFSIFQVKDVIIKLLKTSMK